MVIDFKLIRFQLAAMCLRQHKEYQHGLCEAKILNAWVQNNHLYVTYDVPVNENGEPKISRPTFRYNICIEDGTIHDVAMVRTASHGVINPDKIEC